MKSIVIAGVGVALIAGISMAYASNKNRKGEPVEVGQKVRVVYGRGSTMTEAQALALSNFVLQWGDMVDEPRFISDSELEVVAEVAIAQPNGIPDIPGPDGIGDLFVSSVEFL